MTPRERLRAAASSPWMRLVLGVAISATVWVLWMRGLHRSKFMTVEWSTADLANIPTQKGMWCVTFHARLRASQQLHHCASRSSQKTLESWQSLSLRATVGYRHACTPQSTPEAVLHGLHHA
jgi:hypothetical protein